MQVTKQADRDGVVMVLGTIGVYKGNNKQTNKPQYSNIPFVAYNTATAFIKPDCKMLLHGRLNSYIKDDGSQYGQLVVQIQVNSAYPIATSQDVTVTDNDLPF
ncbi:hypothetical protein ACA617_15315 [Lactiplantibacillus pentosus]